MTVNELIQQLQGIPDSLKNCDIVMRQYDCCDDVTDIYKIYVEVLGTENASCYKDVTFEEAEKMEWYDASVILA